MSFPDSQEEIKAAEEEESYFGDFELCPHLSYEATRTRINSSEPIPRNVNPFSHGEPINGDNIIVAPTTFMPDTSLYCHGTRKFFELCHSTGDLFCYSVKNRVRKLDSDLPAWMENNCYMRSTRSSEKVFVAFRTPGSDRPRNSYQLGIVRKHIFSYESRDSPHPGKCDCVFVVEEWMGGCIQNQHGQFYPDFFDFSELGSEVESKFVLRHFEFGKDDDFDIVPLNQFSGESRCWQRPDLINQEDKCLQASSHGPDIFPVGFSEKVSINPRHNPPQHKPDDSWKHYSGLLGEDIVKNDPILKAQYREYRQKAQSAGNEVLTEWNRMPRKSVQPKARCLHATVTTSNGDPLTQKMLSTLNNKVKGKKMVPDITDCVNESHILRFFCLGKEGFKAVDKEWREEGHSEKFTQELLRANSDYVFSALVTNKSKLFRNKNRITFVKVFAGSTNVPSSNDYVYSPDKISVRLPENNVMIVLDICEHQEIEDLVSLSTVCCEPGLHPTVINMRHSDLVRLATGRRGNSHDRRSLQPVGGALTYLGNRMSTSQSQPSPNEGPRVVGQYQLYNHNSHDHRFFPPFVSFCKFLSHCLFWNSLALFHAGLRIATQATPDKLVGFCELLILTNNNFCCASHIDINDNVDRVHSEMVKKLAREIRDSDLGVPDKHGCIEKLCDFFDEMGVSIPTSCGYQEVRPDGAPRLFVWQFFVMESLGIAIAIRDFTTHIFMGGLIQHNTAVPVYHGRGKVWVARSPSYLHPPTQTLVPQLDVTGWGSGRNNRDSDDTVALAVKGVADDGSNWVDDFRVCGKVGEPIPTSLLEGSGPYANPDLLSSRPDDYAGIPGCRVTTYGRCFRDTCVENSRHMPGELCGKIIYNSEDEAFMNDNVEVQPRLEVCHVVICVVFFHWGPFRVVISCAQTTYH